MSDPEIQRRRETLTLPLGGGGLELAFLSANWPMTQEEWDRFQHLLEVMKPALVAEPKS